MWDRFRTATDRRKAHRTAPLIGTAWVGPFTDRISHNTRHAIRDGARTATSWSLRARPVGDHGMQDRERVTLHPGGDRQLTRHHQRRAAPPDGGARVQCPQSGETHLVEELGGLADAPQRAVGTGRDPLEAEPLVWRRRVTASRLPGLGYQRSWLPPGGQVEVCYVPGTPHGPHPQVPSRAARSTTYSGTRRGTGIAVRVRPLQHHAQRGQSVCGAPYAPAARGRSPHTRASWARSDRAVRLAHGASSR